MKQIGASSGDIQVNSNALGIRDTTTFAAPNTPTGNPRLLMQNVQACTFTYNAGSQTRAGL